MIWKEGFQKEHFVKRDSIAFGRMTKPKSEPVVFVASSRRRNKIRFSAQWNQFAHGTAGEVDVKLLEHRFSIREDYG